MKTYPKHIRRKNQLSGQRLNQKQVLNLKKSTRSAIKKGQVSPLVKAGAFLKKRCTKAENYLRLINSMDQANIAQAGRLNPRNRRAGGLGDNVANLHFPELATDDIPPAGKNVLREFLPLRETIVADSNLVLANEGDVTACKESLTDYLAEVAEKRERFNKVMEGIEDANENAEAAISEIIKVERELQGLMKACKIRAANRVALAAAGDQIKLERLQFPEFDGSGNFKTWKTNFNALAVHVATEETKKSHLLKALVGAAEVYISKTTAADKTFAQIMQEVYSSILA